MSGGVYKTREVGQRSYFYQTPNLIDDSDLDVYAHRLYSHLKRVAGEWGADWESVETMAKKCHMSVSSVVKAKRTLVEAGLVEIAEVYQPAQGGGRKSHIITIVDIWEENERLGAARSQVRKEAGYGIQIRETKKRTSPGEVEPERTSPDSDPTSPGSDPHSPDNAPHSPGSDPHSPDSVKEYFNTVIQEDINIAPAAQAPALPVDQPPIPEPPTPNEQPPEAWFQERRKPHEPRKRLTVEEHKARTAGATARGLAAQISLEQQISSAFRLNPNWKRRDWGACVQFLKNVPPDQTIQAFANWWYANDWRGKKGQPPAAGHIMELWPQAFTQPNGYGSFEVDPDIDYLRNNPGGSMRDDTIERLHQRGVPIPTEVLLPGEYAY